MLSTLDLCEKYYGTRDIYKLMGITAEQIDNLQRDYVGSQQEMADIKKAYLKYRGGIDKMLDRILFISVEDEPRLQKIVREWIAAGEVPEYKLFTEEPKNKRIRRLKKDRKETLEFQKLQQEKESRHQKSLEQLIVKRDESRGENQIDELTAKYGGVDEKDNIDAGLKKKANKNNGGKKTANRKNANSKTPEHKVANGMVTRSQSRS